ncbi:MAG: ABC transporter ATP-binding protein [Armatimonadota bacterium]
MYKRLIGYIKTYWKQITLAFIFTLLLVVIPLLQPYLIKFLMDYVLSGNEYVKTAAEKIHYLKLIVFCFFMIILLKGYFTYQQSYIMNYAAQSALKKMRDDFFAKMQEMPMSFFSKWHAGEIYSRGNNDITLIISFYTNIVYISQDVLTIVLCLGVMFYLDWFMTLMILLVSPLVALTISRFAKYVERATHKLQSKIAEMSTIIYDNITNIKVVKSFTREKYEVSKFYNKNEEALTSQMKLVQFSATQPPIVEFVAGIGFAIVIVMGAMRVINGAMTLGDIMAYWGFMVLMSNPINRSAGLYTMFRTAKAAATRVFDLMDMPKESEDGGKADMPQVKGNIDFEGVTFEYDKGRPVLSNINLSIKEGEVIALVGKNGSGKSTLASLVARFYNPCSGNVKIDGVDVKDVNLKSLRTQIGLVPQDTFLFSGTVKENIRYGKLDATEDELTGASKRACAHDFIMNLKDGYETEVGDRGCNLSGGQRQRIVIARALLKNPKILILDEFTSGIDTESETIINKAVDELMKGRTCIVIAHKLATIKNSDKIVVLDSGRILEQGRYNDLIANQGRFFKMSEAQVFNLDPV